MKDGIVIHVEAPENSTTVDNSLSKLHQACRVRQLFSRLFIG